MFWVWCVCFKRFFSGILMSVLSWVLVVFVCGMGVFWKCYGECCGLFWMCVLNVCFECVF